MAGTDPDQGADAFLSVVGEERQDGPGAVPVGHAVDRMLQAGSPNGAAVDVQPSPLENRWLSLVP
ncbi:hypothetical protein [Streptomyces exfoliatus]|uniref:hypothetical protein n=1 Tax=Streptomyces exfoliatus TaxID=1905 RepID=UPI003C2F92AE